MQTQEIKLCETTGSAHLLITSENDCLSDGFTLYGSGLWGKQETGSHVACVSWADQTIQNCPSNSDGQETDQAP